MRWLRPCQKLDLFDRRRLEGVRGWDACGGTLSYFISLCRQVAVYHPGASSSWPGYHLEEATSLEEMAKTPLFSETVPPLVVNLQPCWRRAGLQFINCLNNDGQWCWCGQFFSVWHIRWQNLEPMLGHCENNQEHQEDLGLTQTNVPHCHHHHQNGTGR